MTKDVGNDGGIEAAQLGKLLGDEGTNADILKTNRVYHAAGGLADPRRGVTGHGLGRQTFDNEATESVQVDKVSELNAVCKGTAGSDNWIFEGKTSDTDLKVNFSGP